MERYNRQMMLPEVGELGQRKLLDARVLIVGVGGLGSPIALYLTAAGIGTLGIMDPDVVSLSNLQRQVLYSTAEVGEMKVTCATNRLKAMSPETVIKTYPFSLNRENVEAIIADYDVVVDGCDNFATRYIMNDACERMKIPYVYGAIGAFCGQVACFDFSNGISYRSLYPEQEEYEQLSPAKGVLGVVPGIVGTIQAAEVIKYVVGCGTNLINRLFTIDVLTMESQIIDL